MSFRNSPWSGRPTEGYFIKDLNGRTQFCNPNKELVFEKFREMEKEGFVGYIEDMEGNKLT